MTAGPHCKNLREVIGRSLILVYQEQPDRLYAALKAEGLQPEILRARHTPEELQFSRTTRTFMSHYAAWQRVADTGDYTLICESDFVPCASLGSLPTFWPLHNPLAYGYLYQGSPRLLALLGDQPFLRGDAVPVVGYVINKNIAEILIRFYREEMERNDPAQYWLWDAHLQWFAMGQGAEAFIPLRHYGEHGGAPNPDHLQSKTTARAGVHRADNLVARLCFLPDYANGSRLKFSIERCKGRALGWARLFTGRWVLRTNVYSISPAAMIRMYIVGIRRLAGF